MSWLVALTVVFVFVGVFLIVVSVAIMLWQFLGLPTWEE